MKFSFRITASVISFIMLGVFFYQLYWLNGLYNTTVSQVQKDIRQAMEIADQNELFMRIELLSQQASPDGGFTFNVKANENEVQVDSTVHQLFVPKNDPGEVSVWGDLSVDGGYEKFRENSSTTEKLANYIQRGIHQAIDPHLNIDMATYDSLLRAELSSRNIIQDFTVQLVRLSNDSVLAQLPREINIQDSKQFYYSFGLEENLAFRLLIKNPEGKVFAQMAGILSTSVVIFALLMFVFVYLLKTIRRLQTEEELKTNFINNMTHELKTPIAVSYAAIDALLVSGRPASEERRKKYLNIAKEQMEQLTGLVEQILSMSRKDNKKIDLKPEKISLAEIANNLAERTKLFLDKEVNFELNIETDTVVADKMHLFNMLNNLVENGVKYGGEKVNIKISSFEDNELVSIRIEDDGPGIDPKYQSRVFDKFYRIPTGNSYNVKGYGLGLFYVKEMTERHGGTVELESKPGKGAAFTIKIPDQ